MTTDPFAGATSVRYGAFVAMMSGDLGDSEAGKPTWKVWYENDDEIKKVCVDLTREQAVLKAQVLAAEWRALGRPEYPWPGAT